MIYDSISPLGTEPSRYHSDDNLTGSPGLSVVFPQEPQLLFYIADPHDVMNHHVSQGSWGLGDCNNSPKLLCTPGFEPLTWSTWHTVKGNKFPQ